MKSYVGHINKDQKEVWKEELEPPKKIMVFQLKMNSVVDYNWNKSN